MKTLSQNELKDISAGLSCSYAGAAIVFSGFSCLFTFMSLGMVSKLQE